MITIINDISSKHLNLLVFLPYKAHRTQACIKLDFYFSRRPSLQFNLTGSDARISPEFELFEVSFITVHFIV